MTKRELIRYYENLTEGKGIVIVTNFTNYLLISKNTMVSKTGFMSLKDYDYNLNNNSPDFTINEIWEVSASFGFTCTINLNNISNKTCIYNRNCIELTMDEIAKKFNIPVSQLKIKK